MFYGESIVEDEEEGDEDKTPFDSTIMPQFIICLEAPDDFLKQRIMNLPEAVVSGTHNTEKELMRRLGDYRSVNTEEETVLNYFDELEFTAEKIGQWSECSFPF